MKCRPEKAIIPPYFSGAGGRCYENAEVMVIPYGDSKVFKDIVPLCLHHLVPDDIIVMIINPEKLMADLL